MRLSAASSTNEEAVAEITTAPATVFPNPVRHTLWLDVPAVLAEQNLVFNLIDLTGTSLLRTNRTFTAQGRQAVPVDWDHYPAGMYLLTVSAEDGYRHTFRITKN